MGDVGVGEEVLKPESLGGLRVYSAGEIEKPECCLVYSEPGVGKGHPYGTRILTPSGWVAIEDLQVGTVVCNSTGGVNTVTRVHDRGILDVFKVTMNDGSSSVVDGDHIWTARRHSSKSWEDVETRDLASRLHQRWSIPMCQPVYMEHKETALHPYVMGVLLGDGGFTDGTISLATDKLTAKRVESLLTGGVRLNPRVKEDNYRLVLSKGKANPLQDEIRRCGLHGLHSYDKFIPADYMFNSVWARTELLRGLMDTDGELTISANGHSITTAFCSSSSKLMEDVAFLVESLGGVARRSVRSLSFYTYKGERRQGRPCYKLYISLMVNPFETRTGWHPPEKYKPSRVVKSIDQAGQAEVRCISVDSADQLYITEHCIVTHNTPFLASGNRVAAFHPVLVIDCDGGPKSLRRRYPEVKVVSPISVNQLQGIWDDMLRGKARQYRTIMVDGTSNVQYRSYEHLLGTEPTPGKDPKYHSMVKFKEPNWENHGYQNSATQMAIMCEIIKELQRKFEQHFFITAWRKNVAENAKAPDSWEPAFTPAAAAAIDGRFDSILYFYKERQNQKFVKKLRSAGDPYVMCRDRDDRLPDVLVDPTMQLLAKHWGLDHSLVEL